MLRHNIPEVTDHSNLANLLHHWSKVLLELLLGYHNVYNKQAGSVQPADHFMEPITIIKIDNDATMLALP